MAPNAPKQIFATPTALWGPDSRLGGQEAIFVTLQHFLEGRLGRGRGPSFSIGVCKVPGAVPGLDGRGGRGRGGGNGETLKVATFYLTAWSPPQEAGGYLIGCRLHRAIISKIRSCCDSGCKLERFVCQIA